MICWYMFNDQHNGIVLLNQILMAASNFPSHWNSFSFFNCQFFQKNLEHRCFECIGIFVDILLQNQSWRICWKGLLTRLCRTNWWFFCEEPQESPTPSSAKWSQYFSVWERPHIIKIEIWICALICLAFLWKEGWNHAFEFLLTYSLQCPKQF